MKRTYAEAGVDIDAKAGAIKEIGQLVKATYRKEVLSEVGLFGSMFEFTGYDEPVLISSIDGVGTKLKIATALDAPRIIHGDIVETPLEDGPWGARGVGEHVMVQTAPAIANALFQATGIRFTDLPLSAEKVFMDTHPDGPDLSCKLPE